ncbi:MAG TPA: DNA-processing protein DprA [Phnomibacter sp.]|nr:DNA-processing protein DprA [Phnomibacter sp.]
MNHPEHIYRLALTQVPQIGCVLARALTDHFGSAEAIFHASKKALCEVDGISDNKATHIRNFKDLEPCEAEWEFLQKHQIDLLFLTDEKYPKRLLNCYDPPTVLFYKGHADLNTSRIVNIIGTRNHTDQGKQMTEKLVETLAQHQLLVVSGMAFGIDTQAHKACVKYNVPTVGVLAHGMDTLYPPENAKLARQMLAQGGGLLTEFPKETKPDRHNFPTRNRVVAGLCDATIVVETDIKGGSMITAELAIGYNRDVFAFPGRVNDPKSRGCNELIRRNKAALISSGEDLLEAMNWLPQNEKKKKVQRSLFIDLTPNEKTMVDLLNLHEQMHIDALNIKSGLNASAAAGALLSLELQGVVESLPGKMYRLA